jgi:hypothetical protein
MVRKTVLPSYSVFEPDWRHIGLDWQHIGLDRRHIGLDWRHIRLDWRDIGIGRWHFGLGSARSFVFNDASNLSLSQGSPLGKEFVHHPGSFQGLLGHDGQLHVRSRPAGWRRHNPV